METVLTRVCRFNSLLILITLLHWVGSASAATMAENKSKAIELRLGLSGANIDHEETPAGAQAHTEEGTLPGVYLSFKEHAEHLYGAMVINYYKGKVDYNGQAQDTLGNYLGLISTETDTELLDVNYRIGGLVNSQIEMYGGFGYRYWRRDIDAAILPDSTPVDGLLQRITWFYGLVGAKYHFIAGPDFGMAVNLQARRTINPKIHAKNSTVSNGIDLDESWGYHVSLPIKINSSSYAVTIEPFATRWQLDQATDDLGGVVPDNETNTYGVNFIFSW